MKYVLMLLALGIGAPPALADDKPDCDDPQTTVDQNQCADMAFEKADKELNALWPKVKGWAGECDENSTNPDAHDCVNSVLAAQRAWLAYRDAQCQMEGLQMHGGTGEGPLIGNCRATLTEERVKSLKELIEP